MQTPGEVGSYLLYSARQSHSTGIRKQSCALRRSGCDRCPEVIGVLATGTLWIQDAYSVALYRPQQQVQKA